MTKQFSNVVPRHPGRSLLKWKLVAVPLVAAVMVACGGGGGGGSNDSTVSVSMTGVVAKGPAKGAAVRVFAADGTLLAGPVMTGDGGSYTLSFVPSAGPIRIEADLAGADIEDELNPGTTYKGKAGETLRAVVDTVPASMNVTPFSDMAADLAVEAAGSGALSADAVKDANRKVRQVLNNVDFLVADPKAGEMLTALKAVQQLVNDPQNTTGLTQVLTNLRAAATSSPEGLKVTAAFVDALKAACTDCGSTFNSVAAAEPLPVGQTTALDSVKSLFKDLRDTLLAMSNDGGTGDLDQAGNRVNDALKAVVQPVDDELLTSIALVTKADDMLRAFKAGDLSARTATAGNWVWGRIYEKDQNGNAIAPSYLPQFECIVSKATVVTTSSGDKDVGSDYTSATAEVTPTTANAVNCYGVGTVGRLVPGADDGFGYHHSSIFLAKTGGYDYVHQLRKSNYDRTVSTRSERVRAVYGTVDMTRNADGDLTAASIRGNLMPGLIGSNKDLYETMDRVAVNLTMSAQAGEEDVGATFAGSMALLKKDGTEASRIDINRAAYAGKVLDTEESYSYPHGGGQCFGPYVRQGDRCVYTYPSTEEFTGTLVIDASLSAPGVKFQGVLDVGRPAFDKANQSYAPTLMSLQGKLYEADGGGYRQLLDGKASLELLNYSAIEVDSEDVLAVKVGFDGKISIKNRPEMGFTFVATRNDQKEESASGTFFWNNKTMRFAADGTSKALTVSNDDGVQFVIPQNGSNADQPITRSGVRVGVINVNAKRISYVDGTYEQF